MMKIALVWPAPNRLIDITVRFERYVRGFEALGHRVVTVCRESAAEGYCHAVHAVRDPESFQDSGLWRDLALDAAVIITWLGIPETVASLKSACPHVVSVSDSDGMVGVRLHPLTTLRRMVAFHSRWGMKVRAAKHWAQLMLGGYRSAEHPLIESAAAADLITVTSPGAQTNVRALLSYYRRSDLIGKVAVVPYPVDDNYLVGEVASPKNRVNRLVAIGRWDDPQKDASLLVAGIERAAAQLPETEFVLIGRNGIDAFASLCRRVPRVRYLGTQTPQEIADLLRSSRALVLSSRWESGPIVAFEALASGASVIGPAWVPACDWSCGEGPFGTLFHRRSGVALATAIVREITAWRVGERNPQEISAYFRPKFDPVNVCREMLRPATLIASDGKGRHEGRS